MAIINKVSIIWGGNRLVQKKVFCVFVVPRL